MNDNTYWTNQDIRDFTGCGQEKARQIIHAINKKLAEKGCIVFRDRCPRVYVYRELGVKA